MMFKHRQKEGVAWHPVWDTFAGPLVAICGLCLLVSKRNRQVIRGQSWVILIYIMVIVTVCMCVVKYVLLCVFIGYNRVWYSRDVGIGAYDCPVCVCIGCIYSI